MALVDSGFDRTRPQIIGYRDPELSPFAITAQTDENLRLFRSGIVAGSTLGNFLLGVTFPHYLNNAKGGSQVLFVDEALRSRDFDPEVEESARHAYVVMAWMHDRTKWRYVPTGFSRRGMLAAPTTQETFVARIDQMTAQLWAISHNNSRLQGRPEASLSMLRTISFFRTGSSLEIHLPESERISAQMEREKLESLLGDTKVDL